MISVGDVTFGKPYFEDERVYIPMAMTATSDDDDEPLPEFSYGWMHVFVTPANIRAGRTKEAMEEYLDAVRTNYAPITFERLRDALRQFLATNDLTLLIKDWFPDPESPTRH